MTDAPRHVARTIKGFCQAYGIGRTTFYRLVEDGTLKVVKCGSRTLVLESDARAWLDRLPAGTTVERRERK